MDTEGRSNTAAALELATKRLAWQVHESVEESVFVANELVAVGATR